jgi:hypothetical protein
MTFVWFVISLIANNVGGHEPLDLNPVNAWSMTQNSASCRGVACAGRGVCL